MVIPQGDDPRSGTQKKEDRADGQEDADDGEGLWLSRVDHR
jgi:hypothetical protein